VNATFLPLETSYKKGKIELRKGIAIPRTGIKNLRGSKIVGGRS
jgi:hypothetical protein